MQIRFLKFFVIYSQKYDIHLFSRTLRERK